METLTNPEDLVYARTVRLLAVQHAVAEIAGGKKNTSDPESMRYAVSQVRNITRDIPNASTCFIGGIAVQNCGYIRFTDNVDVVVNSESYPEILTTFIRDGFARIHEWALRKGENGVLLKLFPEGRKLQNSHHPIPHPSELGGNGSFASLTGLIRLKLNCCNRMSHQADIVELLKRRIHEIEAIRLQLPETLRPEFNRLTEQARRELGQ